MAFSHPKHTHIYGLAGDSFHFRYDCCSRCIVSRRLRKLSFHSHRQLTSERSHIHVNLHELQTWCKEKPTCEPEELNSEALISLSISLYVFKLSNIWETLTGNVHGIRYLTRFGGGERIMYFYRSSKTKKCKTSKINMHVHVGHFSLHIVLLVFTFMFRAVGIYAYVFEFRRHFTAHIVLLSFCCKGLKLYCFYWWLTNITLYDFYTAKPARFIGLAVNLPLLITDCRICKRNKFRSMPFFSQFVFDGHPKFQGHVR